MSSDVTSNDAHNICSMVIENTNSCVLIASVYRTLWASACDTKDLFNLLSLLTCKNVQVAGGGDFNIYQLATPAVELNNHPIFNFLTENDLIQLVHMQANA